MYKRVLMGIVFAATFSIPLIGLAALQCPNLTRNLSRGSVGADVSALQSFLVSKNPD